MVFIHPSFLVSKCIYHVTSRPFELTCEHHAVGAVGKGEEHDMCAFCTNLWIMHRSACASVAADDAPAVQAFEQHLLTAGDKRSPNIRHRTLPRHNLSRDIPSRDRCLNDSPSVEQRGQ